MTGSFACNSARNVRFFRIAESWCLFFFRIPPKHSFPDLFFCPYGDLSLFTLGVKEIFPFSTSGLAPLPLLRRLLAAWEVLPNIHLPPLRSRVSEHSLVLEPPAP